MKVGLLAKLDVATSKIDDCAQTPSLILAPPGNDRTASYRAVPNQADEAGIALKQSTLA